MQGVNILQGDHVYLRGVELKDTDQILAWENNTDIWVYSGTLLPYTRETIQRFTENPPDLNTHKQVRFMISANKDSRAVGCIDLFEYDPFHQRAGTGILIAPDERHKGFGMDALNLLKKYVFHVLCLHQLYCTIPYFNEASLRLFTRAGFEITGCRKGWLRTDNGYTDEYFLQLFNSPAVSR